ncbi:MAG: CocE/NonD family hydrolase [Thermoplasmatota archaeon]
MVARGLVAVLLLMGGLAGCLNTDEGGDAAATGDGDAGAQALALPPREHGEVATPPGEYNFTGPYGQLLEPGILEILPPVRHYEPSSNGGVDMEMGIWRPDTDGPVPVIVQASPYYGWQMSDGRSVVDKAGYFGSLIDTFVPMGYAVVGLSIRGTGDSGGCNDLMGPEERADLDEAVTWLGTQEWSNGNVAMIGLSYDGSTPWTTAATGNPHLKTIVPISGVPDMYSLMYRNGSSESRGPVILNTLYFVGDAIPGDAQPQRTPERLLCPQSAEGVGWSLYSAATGAPDPLGFWEARNQKPLVEAHYNGSIFSIQGLQDWNVDPSQSVPWGDDLERQGLHVKQLLGQWGHDYPDRMGDDDGWHIHRADFKEILLAWFDQELKGIAQDTGPAVQVMDDLGRWRNEEHYPPRDTDWQTYHLTPAKRLATEPGDDGSIILLPSTGIVVQPPAAIPLETAAVAVDFELPPADEERLIVGLPKVHVTVTPHGPGGYMAAYLYDHDPAGNADDRIIGWTSMNLAFAHGGTDRQEVVPGQPLRVNMEIQPMDSVIQEGHQLVLRLWVFTDGDRLPTLPPSSVALEMGEAADSVLKLPTVVRGPEAYFEPPRPAP